ncbi:MAG TPA: replication protein RepA [Bryobacteraceae bacterium]|nr:replication protein RepA [Bryobacteraceae bacterium]
MQNLNARRVFGHNTGGTGAMESAGTSLKRMLPQLEVSRQKLRQAEGSCIVRLKREGGKQNVGFSSRPFVLCGLPVRKSPAGELLYERRNGDFVLQITGHPNYGLPFGQDRIVPIYLATLAVRQQSQTIRFRTASEMLETFGMHKGGKEYRRLVAAFERIFGATIFFGTDTLRGTAKVVQRSRFSFFREAQIWYSRDPEQYPVSDQFENVIVLSDEFYREIVAHPIPADLEAVKVLAGAPAVLDLFMWLSYRCFVAKCKEIIPLFGSRGLASQIGSIEYARPRRFREKLDGWLESIRVLWPECPAKISNDGTGLEVNRATAVLVEQKACG